MAGLLADIPGPRMAIDQDGSTLWINGPQQAWLDITATSVVNAIKVDGTMVSTSTDGNGVGTGNLAVMFPEPRDFKGLSWGSVVWRAGFNDIATVKVAQYSTDATTPSNGTWTNLGASGGFQQQSNNFQIPSSINHRAAIYAQNVTGVKGIKMVASQPNYQGITFTFGFSSVQLFGVRQASDHLAFWHPTLDQALSPGAFDWGETWPGDVRASRQFRLKNMGATLTANSPSVAYSDITGVGFGTNTVQVSTNDSTYANSITSLANIAAGAISPIYYCKLNAVATRTSVNPIAGRLVATATSWS